MRKASNVCKLYAQRFALILSCFLTLLGPIKVAFADSIYDGSLNDINTNTALYDRTAVDCSASAAGPTGTLSGGDRQQQIFNFLTQKGLTKIQAAGILGNMGGEGSSFNPAGEQSPGAWGDMSDGGGRAVGIVQWDSGRRPAVIRYMQSNGINVIELEHTTDKALLDKAMIVELNYVWKELTESYANTLKNLKAAPDVETAVNAFMGPNRHPGGTPVSVYEDVARQDGYENPGTPRGKVRVDDANKVLAQPWANGASTGSTDTSINTDTVSSTCAAGNVSALGKGSGKFTTNTSITYPGVETMLARAQQLNDPSSALYKFVCQTNPGKPQNGPNCHDDCDYLASEVWGYANSGRSYAVGDSPGNGHWQQLLHDDHAHPGDRNPPVGAFLFYSTGKGIAGHIVTYLGDNNVLSNDVLDSQKGRTGGAYITSASNIETGAWHLQYLGWADPVVYGTKNK